MNSLIVLSHHLSNLSQTVNVLSKSIADIERKTMFPPTVTVDEERIKSIINKVLDEKLQMLIQEIVERKLSDILKSDPVTSIVEVEPLLTEDAEIFVPEVDGEIIIEENKKKTTNRRMKKTT
jgi:hypothetical protein